MCTFINGSSAGRCTVCGQGENPVRPAPGDVVHGGASPDLAMRTIEGKTNQYASGSGGAAGKSACTVICIEAALQMLQRGAFVDSSDTVDCTVQLG